MSLPISDIFYVGLPTLSSWLTRHHRLLQRFNRQKEEDAKIKYAPDRSEEDAEDPDTSTNAPEE